MPNSNNGQIVLGLDIPKTVNQINADIKKLEKQLEQVKATGVLDTDKTVKQLNAQIKSLQTQLKTIEIKATVDQKSIQKTGQQIGSQIKNATKGSSVASEILNASDLDKQGKTYILKVSNTIEATKKEIQSKLKNSGYFDIEIKGVEKANGQIKSIIVNATNAKGVLEQLNFERAKMQKGGKVTNALVQTDDVKVLGTISSSIDKVQGNLSTLKSKWEEQGVLVGDFKTKVEQLENSIVSVGSKGELSGLESQIKALKTEASQIAEVNKIQLSMSGEGSGKSYSFEVTELIQKYKNLGLTQEQAKAKVKELSDAHNNLNTILNQNVSVYSSLEARNKAIIEADEKRTFALNKANNEYREMALTAPKILTDIQRLNKVESMQKWADNNSKAVKRYGDDIKRIIEKFAQLDVQMNSVEGDKLVAEFKQIQEAARKTGNIGMTAIDKFTTAWEKFGGWSLATGALTKVFSEAKEGIQFAIELDDALTDVAYTSDVSKTQLENLGNSAIKMAKDLNTSAENVLEAVKIYSTANATAEDILRKTKPAIMLSNVSGMSGSESSKTINTALNQFELEDTEENLMDIVDTLEYVSSQLNYDFTEGMKEITEGIEASGNVAKNAGLDMQEYATMVGLAVERTGQSGSTIGNAYKTIFSRITAASTTEGTLDEDISKAEASLRAIGVQVRDSENDFRDLSYLMSDIGNVWNNLTDTQKAKVGYDVAGIRQLNVLNSLFGSWEQYSSIMKDVDDRTGISLKNQEEYANSLQGHLDDLTATGQSIWNNILDSETLKSGVDLINLLLTKLDNLTSSLGELGTLGVGIGGFTAIFNRDKSKQRFCPLWG